MDNQDEIPAAPIVIGLIIGLVALVLILGSASANINRAKAADEAREITVACIASGRNMVDGVCK